MTFTRLVVLLLLMQLVGCADGGLLARRGQPSPSAESLVMLDGMELPVTTLLQGSVLYHRNDCRKCHYSGARGGSEFGGPNLVDDEWFHCDGSINGIRSVILKGITKEQLRGTERSPDRSMPSAEEMDLSDADVTAIAAYLYAIGQLDR